MRDFAARLGRPGAFGTVWLAYDLDKKCATSPIHAWLPLSHTCRRHVSVKVTTASRPEGIPSQEAEVLRKLTEASCPHTLALFEHFEHESANGTHDVLILEPVVPLLDLFRHSEIRKRRKQLLRQAVEALAFVHGQGVAHGGQTS